MTKNHKKKLEELEKTWLRGTTCNSICSERKTISVFYVRNNRFVIMKHAGHSEYVDRTHGVGYCPTYYKLYDLDNEEELDCFGEPCLKMWEGRWKKAYWKEVEELIGKQLSS